MASYQCSYCDRQLSSRTNRSRHVRVYHASCVGGSGGAAAGELPGSSLVGPTSEYIKPQLRLPFSMIISGQSSSGKSYFCATMLKNPEIYFDGKFDKIMYCYTMYQPVLFQSLSNVDFFYGFPSESDIPANCLVVLDDLLSEASNSELLLKLFTVYRHKNVSVIFITQNFYHEGKALKTASRNAHYLAIFPNPRDMSMVKTLGYQMYPHKSNFLPDAFRQAIATPRGFLFIDLKPDTDQKLRVLSGMNLGEHTYAYLPK